MKNPSWVLRDTSIFSPLEDSILFISPFLIFGLFVLLMQSFHVSYSSYTPQLIQLFYLNLIDTPHTYSTLWRVHENRRAAGRSSLGILVLPLLILFVLTMLFQNLTYTEWVIQIIYYVNIFHFARQQWGWLRYTSKRDPRYGEFEKRSDAFFVILTTVVYFLAFDPPGVLTLGTKRMVKLQEAGTFLSLQLPKFVVISYWIGIFLFFCYQVFLIIQHKKINVSKLLVIVTTWLAWYWWPTHSPLPFTNLALGALHGIPYIYLVFYISNKKESGALPKGRVLFAKWISFYVLLLIPALGITLLGLRSSGYSKWLPLFLTFNVCHFVFDSYIWKTRRSSNRELRKTLRFEEVPA